MREKTKLDFIKVNAILDFVKKDETVFDFNDETFDVFSNEIIGKKLCSLYKEKPFMALNSHLQKCENFEKLKILKSLLNYYVTKELYKNAEKQEFQNFNACKAYMELLEINCVSSFGQLVNEFGSSYIEKTFNNIYTKYKKDPTEVIGKAKELIERSCKIILAEEKQIIPQNAKVPILIDLALKQINLKPIYIDNDPTLETNIRSFLKATAGVIGQLEQMASLSAALRGTHGSGHGKPKDFLPLQVRHAKLMINSAVTITSFLFDSYRYKRDPKTEIIEIYDFDSDLYEKYFDLYKQNFQ